MKKYFNDRQKSSSLVMGMHVDSEKKVSMLRSKDIIDVINDLKVEEEQSLEIRIDIVVNSTGERAINAFFEKAIGVL
ncbi:hypothetical protein BDFB_010940 [Asbolus verrucosus]|uniref:Uncharacterized protein n=1 Tax=Asbolus verrucosus TaxID=1661398 RepID=A0A482VIT4_ASBVE|nr:hypothetical protein BDFB_010940 [Asbolus verrucosus]